MRSWIVPALFSLALVAGSIYGEAAPAQSSNNDGLPRCPKDENSPQYIAGRPFECLPGNINGIKVLIPSYYLNSYPEYDGRNWLSKEPIKRHPTYANAITDVGFLVRLSSLRPIAAEQDATDYLVSRRSLNPFYYSTWMTVSVEAKGPPQGGLSGMLANFLDPNWRGPYDRSVSQYGLEVYKTRRTRETERKSGHLGLQDIYWDGESKGTSIACEFIQPGNKAVEPFDSCHHYFAIKEFSVLVDSIYSSSGLPHWREIEDYVRTTLRSFVVGQGG